MDALFPFSVRGGENRRFPVPERRLTALCTYRHCLHRAFNMTDDGWLSRTEEGAARGTGHRRTLNIISVQLCVCVRARREGAGRGHF